jgi:hypothetical protein
MHRSVDDILPRQAPVQVIGDRERPAAMKRFPGTASDPSAEVVE